MLPILNVPVFDVVLPSTGKKIQMRPYLVKEQKVLLMAQFSNSELDVFQAIRSVLEACMITPGVDIGKLPRFDVEYLFVKLRSKSVGESIDLSYKCMIKTEDRECGGVFKHVLDIDKLAVTKVDKKKQTIQLTPEIGIKLRYPSFEVLEKYSGVLEEKGTDLDQMFSLIFDCTENVFSSTEVFTDFKQDEFVKFLETMNDEQFMKIMAFFEDVPKLNYVIPFKCPVCGHSEDIVLSSLVDFFG